MNVLKNYNTRLFILYNTHVLTEYLVSNSAQQRCDLSKISYSPTRTTPFAGGYEICHTNFTSTYLKEWVLLQPTFNLLTNKLSIGVS